MTTPISAIFVLPKPIYLAEKVIMLELSSIKMGYDETPPKVY